MSVSIAPLYINIMTETNLLNGKSREEWLSIFNTASYSWRGECVKDINLNNAIFEPSTKPWEPAIIVVSNVQLRIAAGSYGSMTAGKVNISEDAVITVDLKLRLGNGHLYTIDSNLNKVVVTALQSGPAEA